MISPRSWGGVGGGGQTGCMSAGTSLGWEMLSSLLVRVFPCHDITPGATAAPRSAPSPCTSRRVGVTEAAPASKYHAVTTVISYCADARVLPALLLPRPPTGCDSQASDPGLPNQLPAALPAGPRNPQPPAGTAVLHPPALGEREAPGRGWLAAPARREQEGGSLITARGERGD